MENKSKDPGGALERLNTDLKRTILLLEEQMIVLNEKLQKVHRFNEKECVVSSNEGEVEASSALVVLEDSVHRLQKVSDRVGGYIRHLNEII